MDKIINTRIYEGGSYYHYINMLKDKYLNDFNQYDFSGYKSFDIEKFFDILKKFNIIDSVIYEAETIRNTIETNYFYYMNGVCISFEVCDILTNDDEDEDDISFEDNTYEQEIKSIQLLFDSNRIKIKNDLIKEINNTIIKDEKKYFYTIGMSKYGNGYTLEKHEAINYTVDIDINYGTGFTQKYESIINSLKTSHEGLYLLWGEPGTGKTTLIRKIISDVNNSKRIIYIPSFMMEHLSRPEFIGFLKSYKNIILLLEDAEHVITDRLLHGSDHGAVSNILNMTAGLLNDIIKVQIIATFNTKRENIDKALLREGRLKHEHEFKRLSIEDAQKIVEHLNIDHIVENEMTLAEIYNLQEYIERKETNKPKQIGFGR